MHFMFYSDRIQPICLPNSPDIRNKNLPGKMLYVAGWGNTQRNQTSDSKYKPLWTTEEKLPHYIIILFVV